MTYLWVVTLTILALAEVANIILGRILRNLQREHARRQDLLLNQLLHATGKTWTPPPADQPAPPVETEPQTVVWTATPEQYPT